MPTNDISNYSGYIVDIRLNYKMIKQKKSKKQVLTKVT